MIQMRSVFVMMRDNAQVWQPAPDITCLFFCACQQIWDDDQMQSTMTLRGTHTNEQKAGTRNIAYCA